MRGFPYPPINGALALAHGMGASTVSDDNMSRKLKKSLLGLGGIVLIYVISSLVWFHQHLDPILHFVNPRILQGEVKHSIGDESEEEEEEMHDKPPKDNSEAHNPLQKTLLTHNSRPRENCKSALEKPANYLNVNVSSIDPPLDLHLRLEYNNQRFIQNFEPFCDDIELLVQHQNPNTSHILVEEHHDQYALTSNHKITRLGNDITLSPEEHKRTTAASLKYVIEELDKMGLTNHMLFFGTLLGAYRHHDFIPWDDDADIVLLSKDVEALRTILLGKALKVADKQVTPNEQYQWIVRTGTDSEIIPIKVANLQNGRYVDIFSFHPTPQGRVGAKYFGMYHIDRVFPTQHCLFGSRVYKCPHDPSSVLKTKYTTTEISPRHKHFMVGLPEYNGIVATLEDADKGRVS